MEIKYILYHEYGTDGKNIAEFPTREALNEYLQALVDVTFVKIIAGYVLEERG